MRRQYQSQAPGLFLLAVWIVALFLCLWLGGCAPAPRDQISVHSGQTTVNAIWRAIFPSVETAAYWLLGKGLDAVRPDEPDSTVADPQLEP